MRGLCIQYALKPFFVFSQLMNLEDLNASLSARSFLERATALSIDYMYLYCFDLESFFTWLSYVELDSFKEVSTFINETPSLLTGYVNDLDTCIDSIVLARRFQEAIDPSRVQAGSVLEPNDDEVALPQLIAPYAGTTQIAFDAALLIPSCHFFVTRYTNEKVGNLFRPLLLHPSITKTTSVLEMAQLHDYIAQMMLMDRNEHPDWFL